MCVKLLKVWKGVLKASVDTALRVVLTVLTAFYAHLPKLHQACRC